MIYTMEQTLRQQGNLLPAIQIPTFEQPYNSPINKKVITVSVLSGAAAYALTRKTDEAIGFGLLGGVIGFVMENWITGTVHYVSPAVELQPRHPRLWYQEDPVGATRPMNETTDPRVFSQRWIAGVPRTPMLFN